MYCYTILIIFIVVCFCNKLYIRGIKLVFRNQTRIYNTVLMGEKGSTCYGSFVIAAQKLIMQQEKRTSVIRERPVPLPSFSTTIPNRRSSDRTYTFTLNGLPATNGLIHGTSFLKIYCKTLDKKQHIFQASAVMHWRFLSFWGMASPLQTNLQQTDKFCNNRNMYEIIVLAMQQKYVYKNGLFV